MSVTDPTALLSLLPEELSGWLGGPVRKLSHGLDLAALGGPSGLAELATSLPERWLVARQPAERFEQGDVMVGSGSGLAALAGDISGSRLTLRLYHLELAPAFKTIASRVAAPVLALGSELDPVEVNLGLFLAPPGGITPAHPDRHHNLLLQVTGTKDVWVEDITATDPVARHRRCIDFFAAPGAGVPVLPPATLVRLGPGEAVYIPPMTMHWTRTTSAEGSTALSVGFSTPRTVADHRLAQIDLSLHHFGWRRSHPFDPARALSRTKAGVVNAMDRGRRRPVKIRRSRPAQR